MNFENYKFNKLNAITQFHIVRRIAPVAGELITVLSNSKTFKKMKSDGLDKINMDKIDFDEIAKELSPVLNAIAKLPDDDVEYVVNKLLSGVSRQVSNQGGYQKIITNDNVIMFEDIKENLGLMFSLAGKSFAQNLGGFINALPSGLKEGALKQEKMNG